MTEHVRNRIVGGIILASLAAIFLPMLFDGAGIERREVPAMPAGEPGPSTPLEPVDPGAEAWGFVDDVAARRGATEDPVDARPRLTPVPSADRETERGPRLDEAGTPVAWSVQLGSFAQEENADALRERLAEDGYEAYVDAVDDAGRVLWRVAVGPRVDAAAAERLGRELGERYALETLVVRFGLGGPGGEG